MEIEKRAFVKSLDDTAEKLRELGFEKKHSITIQDTYFCRKNVSTVGEVQMDEPGSYGLRTRQVNDEKGGELNCKVIKNRGDHQAFIEHETDIESAEQARKILETVGFKAFCIIDKERTEYRSEINGEEVTVNLEDLEDFPPVIEIEIIADREVEERKSDIQGVMDELGVEEEDMIEKSITLLYFRENAEF